MNTWLESLSLGFPKFSNLRYQAYHFATFGNYTYGTGSTHARVPPPPRLCIRGLCWEQFPGTALRPRARRLWTHLESWLIMSEAVLLADCASHGDRGRPLNGSCNPGGTADKTAAVTWAGGGRAIQIPPVPGR